MPANLTNLTEAGIDLADKYVANVDYSLVYTSLTPAGQDFYDSVFSAGGLWSWGQGSYGRLGSSSTLPRSSPAQVGSLTDWKQVGPGKHSLAVKTDGTLWAWGPNFQGQLGLGDSGGGSNRSSPVQVGTLTNWAQVSAAYINSVAIKTDGTLWSWGYNSSGQLGLNDRLHRSSPVQVGSLTNWKSVNASTHVLAVKTDGTLWSWGRNNVGQLGLGTTSPTTISSPVQVGTLTNWKQVATGRAYGVHSVAVKTDGTLWSWGYNFQGQLGLGDSGGGSNRSSPTQVGTLTNWKQVAAGRYHCLAVKTDGTLWSWGNNIRGQLGLGDITYRSSPTQVGSLTNWKAVGAGNGFSFAVKTDGTLWAWGDNINGELGLGDRTYRSSPVQVGSLTSWKQFAVGDRHILITRG